MKLLTWNLHNNRASAVLARVIDDVSPDLLLLQEARQPTIEWNCCHGCPTQGVQWGSWVLARRGSIEPISVEGSTGWVSGGRYIDDNCELYIFSLHSPTSRPNERKRNYVAECRSIVDTITQAVPASAPLVIGGDFNCTIGERLADEPQRNTTAELRALRDWRELGFSVAWRDANPRAPLPQTLRWMKEPTAPYHCDGFLVRNTSISATTIHDDDVVKRHSDHSVVLCDVRI